MKGLLNLWSPSPSRVMGSWYPRNLTIKKIDAVRKLTFASRVTSKVVRLYVKSHDRPRILKSVYKLAVRKHHTHYLQQVSL